MSSDRTVPVPRNGRMAAFLPGGDGCDSAMVIHIEGWQSIFRFTVNLLDQQIDIAAAGRAVLVDLRDHMTPERFDPMALTLLGETRYARLRDRFERDWSCVGCDKDIRVGWNYFPTDDGGSACAMCCAGHPEYVDRLVKRPPDTTPPVVTAKLAGAAL